MSTKDDYIQSQSQWTQKKQNLDNQISRLQTAKSTYSGYINKELMDHIEDFEGIYNKLDNGSGKGDWEGDQVCEVKTMLKDKVKSQYTNLLGSHDIVIEEFTKKISSLQTSLTEANGQISHYQTLINNYKEPETE